MNYLLSESRAITLLALLLAAPAVAQTTPAAAPAPAETETGDSAYSLKGGVVMPTPVPSQGAAAASYELSGTGISGSKGSTEVILTAPAPDRGAPIKTESGAYFYPSVFVGLGRNDNLQTTATNKIASNFLNVAPEVIAEMKNKGDRYTATLIGNLTNYSSSSNDNYANSEIWVAGDNYFSARARMGWALGYLNSADPRGSNNRPISDNPDRWHAPVLKGKFIYGAPEASGRVEADVTTQTKRYDNNREFTAIADLDFREVAGRFFYRLGTRSMALVEARDAKFDYISSLSNDSSTERRYYAGLTWEATAATTGIFKIGRLTKNFDTGGRANFSGSSWEAAVRWLPLTYSAIDFETSRATGEPSGYGSFMINTGTNLVWNHKWTNSLTSRVAAGTLKSDFAGTPRSDDATNFAFTLTYDVLRWLSIGIDMAQTNNKSNDSFFDYKRNVTMFTLSGTL